MRLLPALKKFSLVSLVIIFAGCFSKPSMPLIESFSPPPEFSVMYGGEGRAYRYSGGKWTEDPSNNYEFTVLKRKYEDGWESVKTIHRRHPDYDGRGGSRDQTIYFRVKYKVTPAPDSNKQLHFTVESSLGKGDGYADYPGFKNVKVEVVAEISRFAPFNTYRITQHVDYDEEKLKETVELLKKKDGYEEPFMKMEEEALIYISKNPRNR